ncbi:MAG TPA: CPBP family intramembrane metalloprotease [Panacibacter sp.]|nr:CPBP family intramembrane metalloprotease [Panacibacter sp.]
MKEFHIYISEYCRYVNKKLFFLSILQTAVLIYLNYHNQLKWSFTLAEFFGLPQFFGYYFLFALAFILPYFFYGLTEKKIFNNIIFIAFLIIAPAIYCIRMAWHIEIPISNNIYYNAYWNYIYYLPLRLLIITTVLLLAWRLFDKDQTFYGITKKHFKCKPYLLILLCIMPLILAASTQGDFLAVYPNLNSLTNINEVIHLTWAHQLLFEISYGCDFVGVELFFRGFLILAFVKWVGMDSILPMACFYCTIHFGKPLAECIGSYFGGLFLGIIIYNTKSIYGGVIIHLGIGWFMEIGGYVGNMIRTT